MQSFDDQHQSLTHTFFDETFAEEMQSFDVQYQSSPHSFSGVTFAKGSACYLALPLVSRSIQLIRDLRQFIMPEDIIAYYGAYKKRYEDYARLEKDIQSYNHRCQIFKDFLTAFPPNITRSRPSEPAKTSSALKIEQPAPALTTTPITSAIPLPHEPTASGIALFPENTPFQKTPDDQASVVEKNRTAAYLKHVEEQRKIRDLALANEQKKQKALQVGRVKLQQSLHIAQAQQNLEVAFRRLFGLTLDHLKRLEAIIEISQKKSITYHTLEVLFSGEPGALGRLISSASAGSHRQILIPALAPSGSGTDEGIPVDRLGFFDYTPQPHIGTRGTVVRPHGGDSKLSPITIASIQSTLGRAGINADTLQAFQLARTMQPDAENAQDLLKLYQTTQEAKTAVPSTQDQVCTQAHQVQTRKRR